MDHEKEKILKNDSEEVFFKKKLDLIFFFVLEHFWRYNESSTESFQ